MEDHGEQTAINYMVNVTWSQIVGRSSNSEQQESSVGYGVLLRLVQGKPCILDWNAML